MKFIFISITLVLGGCSLFPEKPCNLRDQNLVQYHRFLARDLGQSTDGKYLADKFLVQVIEREVPAYCWRQP